MDATPKYRFRGGFLLAWLMVAGLGLLSSLAIADDLVTTDADATKETATRSAQIEILLAWGKYALESSRFAEAEARFREVLKLDWNNPPAFELLQEIRTRRSEVLKDWTRSGRTAEANGDLAQAELHYRRVLEESPDYRAAIDGMARLRRIREADRHVRAGLEKYIQEDFPGAEMDFEQALLIDPSDETALLHRAQVQQQVTQSSSLADLRSDAPTWTKYLDALKKLRAGDLEGAERLWREILQAYPGNEAVLSNLEQVKRRRKQEFSSQEMAP
jgi:tetratricopeptide (TPR) repeat protein